jgi:hypothetical protein
VVSDPPPEIRSPGSGLPHPLDGFDPGPADPDEDHDTLRIVGSVDEPMTSSPNNQGLPRIDLHPFGRQPM